MQKLLAKSYRSVLTIIAACVPETDGFCMA